MDDIDWQARAERYRLAWLSARRRAGEAAYEVDVWRRLAKGGPVAPEDEAEDGEALKRVAPWRLAKIQGHANEEEDDRET